MRKLWANQRKCLIKFLRVTWTLICCLRRRTGIKRTSSLQIEFSPNCLKRWLKNWLITRLRYQIIKLISPKCNVWLLNHPKMSKIAWRWQNKKQAWGQKLKILLKKFWTYLKLKRYPNLIRPKYTKNILNMSINANIHARFIFRKW